MLSIRELINSGFNEEMNIKAEKAICNVDKGIQNTYTPVKRLEAATGFSFVDQIKPDMTKVGIFFNYEFLEQIAKTLPLDYFKHIQFTYFYDSIYDLNHCKHIVKLNQIKNINIEYISIIEFGKTKDIKKDLLKYMTKHFDIVFSNPPYNNGLDLNILTAIKNYFDIGVIVHPATWILENKNIGCFKKFKNLFKNNIEQVIIFNGTPVFDIPFISSEVITIFNNKKNDSAISVNDLITKSKYNVDNILDVTIFGDLWFKFGIKTFRDNLKNYKSMLEVSNRFPHFKFPELVKLPILLTEFRCGNPYFNDGYFDEKLGYYVLNKTNSFFTCIAKGDPEKYHFVFDKKHLKLAYSFDTEEERLNFYNYCKSKVFRFILAMRKTNAHNNSKELADTPWLDFTQEWNDKKLCKEFGISEKLWEYINNFIPAYYNDYKSGFEENVIEE